MGRYKNKPNEKVKISERDWRGGHFGPMANFGKFVITLRHELVENELTDPYILLGATTPIEISSNSVVVSKPSGSTFVLTAYGEALLKAPDGNLATNLKGELTIQGSKIVEVENDGIWVLTSDSSIEKHVVGEKWLVRRGDDSQNLLTHILTRDHGKKAQEFKTSTLD